MNKYLAALADMAWLNVMLASLLITVGYYFMGYDDGGSLETNLAKLNTDLANSKRMLQQTEKAMEDANRFQNEVKEIARQFESISIYMPENLKMVDISAIITNKAQLAGVNVSRIEPVTGVEKKAFYEMIRATLSIEGTFPQVLMFLSYLSRVPRLLTFDRMTLNYQAQTQPEQSPILSFNAIMVGYRYLRNATETEVKGSGVPGVPPAGAKP